MSTVIVITPHPNNETQTEPPQTLMTGKYLSNPAAAAILRAAADEIDPPSET